MTTSNIISHLSRFCLFGQRCARQAELKINFQRIFVFFLRRQNQPFMVSQTLSCYYTAAARTDCYNPLSNFIPEIRFLQTIHNHWFDLWLLLPACRNIFTRSGFFFRHDLMRNIIATEFPKTKVWIFYRLGSIHRLIKCMQIVFMITQCRQTTIRPTLLCIGGNSTNKQA